MKLKELLPLIKTARNLNSFEIVLKTETYSIFEGSKNAFNIFKTEELLKKEVIEIKTMSLSMNETTIIITIK